MSLIAILALVSEIGGGVNGIKEIIEAAQALGQTKLGQADLEKIKALSPHLHAVIVADNGPLGDPYAGEGS